jgi:hypothetical protein
VELAFSFVAIPIKNKQHKLIMTLRAVVLFSDETRKVSTSGYWQCDVAEKTQVSEEKARDTNEVEGGNTAPKCRRLYLGDMVTTTGEGSGQGSHSQGIVEDMQIDGGR